MTALACRCLLGTTMYQARPSRRGAGRDGLSFGSGLGSGRGRVLNFSRLCFTGQVRSKTLSCRARPVLKSIQVYFSGSNIVYACKQK